MSYTNWEAQRMYSSSSCIKSDRPYWNCSHFRSFAFPIWWMGPPKSLALPFTVKSRMKAGRKVNLLRTHLNDSIFQLICGWNFKPTSVWITHKVPQNIWIKTRSKDDLQVLSRFSGFSWLLYVHFWGLQNTIFLIGAGIPGSKEPLLWSEKLWSTYLHQSNTLLPPSTLEPCRIESFSLQESIPSFLPSILTNVSLNFKGRTWNFDFPRIYLMSPKLLRVYLIKVFDGLVVLLK